MVEACPLHSRKRTSLEVLDGLQTKIKLSVPGYFMAGALPALGIFICISAGIGAPPSIF